METNNKIPTRMTISAVHRLTGKARSTITNHMKQGKLSYEVDADGNKMLEATEVARVYPEHFVVDEEGQLKPKIKHTSIAKDKSEIGQQYYETLWENEKKERERERRQVEKTLERLENDLDNAHEREKRAGLLLENHSQDSKMWKQQVSEVNDRIARQAREIEQYRRALHKERSKTLFQRLFRF